jgi:tetratricopeptide (TPR) repeat protein
MQMRKGLIQKLRELNPEVAEVHVKLGLIYFQQGKFAQAVPALSKALKLKPALPNADILLAMSLSELGRYGEALPGLEKGFRRSPDAALKRLAGLQLQRAYTGLQKDNKAVEVALELNRLYPDDPEILYHGSRLYANFAYLMLRKLLRSGTDIRPGDGRHRVRPLKAKGSMSWQFESTGLYWRWIRAARVFIFVWAGRCWRVGNRNYSLRH